MTTLEPSLNGQARRHPEAECELCPLNRPDCIFVPSAGPEQSDIVVVGEAPGYQEAKAGRPFVGPSGKLLDHVLTEAGIDPGDVFRTNACLCRPPGNATPPSDAVRCCAGRLKIEIDSRRPRKLFLLGNTASQSILATRTGITTLRAGPPKESHTFPGVDIIPTLHPAACLRQGDSFPSLVADSRKLTGTYIKWEPPTFKVFDDEDSALTAISELQRDYNRLYVDIEVGVDKDEFDHPDRYNMLCVGIGYKAGRVGVIGENACQVRTVQQALNVLLESKDIEAHNGKFDLAGLKAFCGANAKLSFDTMLASYAFDERQGTHALGYLGAEVLGAPEWKKELDRYRGKGDSYAVVPRDVLYQYNAWDAGVGWLLSDHYRAEMERAPELESLTNFLCEASDELIYPEMEGVLVDVEYNRHLFDTYLDSLTDQRREFGELTGWLGFNPNSWQQVKNWLWSKGVDVDSTDKEHMVELRDFGMQHDRMDLVEFAERKLQWSGDNKLHGTYIKGIRSRLYRGRVHPTFLLHGTVSGRLSCRNPNLQNIPRGNIIRAQFIPEPGNVFLQGDYAQAELRVMATLSQDRYLQSVFNDTDRDLFDEIGSVLYGPSAIGNKGLRIRTKAYVYGLSYGREAASVAYEYKLPMAEAQRGMNAFMSLIPDLVRWRKELRHEILYGTEDLVTPFGRHRRFGLITRENQKDVVKEAYAFYPQSIASDICLSALIRLRRTLGAGSSIRIPVHDSILVECPAEHAASVAEFMRRTMEQVATELMGDFVPWVAEVEQGPNWGSLS